MSHPSPPDLSSRTGRKAYARELRMVAVRPRRWGLWLLALGCLLLVLPSAFDIHNLAGWSPSLLGMILGLAAVPLLVISMARRSRYHRTRMRAPLDGREK